MNYRHLIEIVRQQYDYRCGYCGIAEHEAGSLLEIDHFRPLRAGGTNELENLVYCCTTCNRHKGDFWNESEPERLLHPLLDDLSVHIYEQENGFLVGLTSRGRSILSGFG